MLALATFVLEALTLKSLATFVLEALTLKFKQVVETSIFKVRQMLQVFTLYHTNNLKLATTSTGIDVTGTVTADGLTVSTSGTNAEAYFDNGAQSYRLLNRSSDNAFSIFDDSSSAFRLTTASNGDISFYEDTGTTAKLFWDASAESLGINTTSPTSKMTVKATGSSFADASLVLENYNTTDRTYLAHTGGKFYLSNDGSTTHMLVDASGNVGIAHTDFTNYSGKLIVADGSVGGSSFIDIHNNNNNQFVKIGINNNTALIAYDNADEIAFGQMADASGTSLATEHMRLDASGNVGIGRTNPSSYVTDATSLYVKGQIRVDGISNTAALPALTLNDTNSGIFAPVANTIAISTGAAERMRIDASGNLLVGTTLTNPTTGSDEGVALGATGIMLASNANDAALVVNRVSSNGDVVIYKRQGVQVGSVSVSGTNATFNTSSDQRLKDNIVDAPSASDDIDAIQVRSFDWKADGSHQKYGMVAQELQGVAPEAVTGDADSDDMMGVDYSKLVPMMLKEIQSLRARVAQLEGEN
jgi:hypothetical protein